MEKALNAWLANNASFLGMALNTVQQELATEVQAKSA
jgi:hypothetical protein